MLHSPIPNAERLMLEHFSTEELLALFASCQMRSGRIACGDLADAWATLFSRLYLSAEDLVTGMQDGEHRLSEEGERMLREFVHADSAGGGAFVIEVITKGGKIDRAALVMIADLEDIAGIQESGTTALHLLMDACDKGVRPALIERSGKRLLTRVYDQRGMPVLFTLFGLSDLWTDDLDAIAKVFSAGELETIMSLNKTGKNALEVFTEAAERFKHHPPGERNKFFVSSAIRTTNMQGDLRSQLSSKSHQGSTSGAPVQAERDKTGQREDGGTMTTAERYEAMTANPLDDISKLMPKTRRNR